MHRVSPQRHRTSARSIDPATVDPMTVPELLRRQGGVLSRPQAISAGISPDAVDVRLAAGRWRRLHPRVYLAADRPLTDAARVRAAWL